jgi:hypothetical protein
MHITSLVDWARDPVYTGSNRCWSCTAVNLALVAIGVGAAAAITPVAGIGIAVFGVAAVWLRGYVVPGTPTLTRRYLPKRPLALFGKLHSAKSAPTVDPTGRLSTLGVLRDGEPRLSLSFRDSWTNMAASLAGNDRATRRAAGEVLAVPPADIVVNNDGLGINLTVTRDWVGQCPSQTALVADISTGVTLSGDGWTGMKQAERAARVRGIADRCPVCENQTPVSEDTVESCCGPRDVVSVTCPDCSVRLVEFDPAPNPFVPTQ